MLNPIKNPCNIWQCQNNSYIKYNGYSPVSPQDSSVFSGCLT